MLEGTDVQELKWFLLKASQDNKILFGNCYIPPKNSKYYSRNAFDLINVDLVAKTVDLSIENVYMAGDFNAKTRTTHNKVTR